MDRSRIASPVYSITYPVPSGGSQFANHRQRDVFGRHPGQFACDLNLHIFGFLLDQGLGGQNMFHFGCADPVRQGPKSPVVAVWLSQTTVIPAVSSPVQVNDMHDALTRQNRIIMDAEVSRVFVKSFDLNTAFFVFNTLGAVKLGAL